MIDWLIDWLTSYTTHSSHLSFGCLQFPNLKKYNKVSRYEKTWAKTDLPYYTSPEAFWVCFLMSWHEKTKDNFRNLSSCMQGWWCMGQREREEAHHPCKQRGSFVNTNYSSSASVPALSLSLYNSSLQADLVLGFFYLWPPSKVGWCACKKN
jgi:hypothetical protein